MQHQPTHNGLWFLIARSLSGEINIGEEQLLQQLLQHNETLQQQYDLLKRMWHAEKYPEENINEQEKENVSRIIELAITSDQKHFEIKTKGNKTLWLAAGSAAVVIITLGCAWLFTHYNDDTIKKNIQTQTLIAKNGSRTRTI